MGKEFDFLTREYVASFPTTLVVGTNLIYVQFLKKIP
jgi:hypothetical protein